MTCIEIIIFVLMNNLTLILHVTPYSHSFPSKRKALLYFILTIKFWIYTIEWILF